MKRLLTFALLLVLSCPMMAEHVDAQKAETVAHARLQNQEITLVSMAAFDNLYVFNAENGFVIVAANDCARPILAYSLDFPFKTEDMPENIHKWLQSLNEEIQDAIDKKLEASDEVRQEWELLLQGEMPEPKHRSEVEPLIKTHWDQHAPYSNLCPDGSLTGCVATAMAQVMKYWEWPTKGTGSHSYVHDIYGQISANFGNTTYDWDNMVEQVSLESTEPQQTAVATLIYQCGVSVDMNYDPSGSWAYSSDVVIALPAYFDYNQSDIQWRYAEDYTASSWIALIKTELDNRRPVYYSGRDEDSGHAFICDGYDADDYLHFNWGWSGFCDGYYAYGALEPGSGGAGSGNGSYNDVNCIITGVHPNNPPIAAPQNCSASVSDRTVRLQWSSVSGASRYKMYRDGFVIQTNVTGTTYTDSNVVYGNHTYFVKAVNANGICSLRSEELLAQVNYPGPVATNFAANVQGNDVHLSWTAPASESAKLSYGEGDAASSFYGSSSGMGFTWGQRFTPEQLSEYAGMAVTSVEVYLEMPTHYTLYIYKEEGGDFAPLVTKDLSISDPGWHTVNLTTPFMIDYTNNMIVALYNDNSDYQYVAPYMPNYDGDSNARLFLSGGTWHVINNTISWLIKTNITDGTFTYSVYRNEQAIATNLNQTSYVDYGLQEGFYQYSVRTHYYGTLSDPCEAASVVIGQVSYALTDILVTEPACNGGDDGTVAVAVTGGFMPLVFELGGQTATVSESHYTFQNVSAGSYALRVTDNTGNVLTTTVEVGEPEALSAGEIKSGSETITNGGVPSTIMSLHDATSGQGSLTYRWKQNGNVISDSNAAQYTPRNLQPGTYYFTREVMDACTDWMESEGEWEVVVRQTDVNENNVGRLEVYPNPTNDKVTVNCDAMTAISVFSMTGQLIATMEVDDDHADLDLTDLQPGVYVLMIRTRDGANCITRISKH